MSLSELTRNAFQTGVSPAKWIKLCKLFISKSLAHATPQEVQVELSNSILVLFRNYPGDLGLQEYIKTAIQDGPLSLPSFISTFLSGARSPDLQNAATLDMLCRIALNAHYASGLPPIGSMVASSEPLTTVLGTVQDSMALLKTAYSFPSSQFSQLITDSSELLILLLSCVTDVSRLTTSQALVYFADVSEMTQMVRLSPEVRQVLETFALTLGLFIGDDAKAAREAQMMHTLQLTLGKGDIFGPNSEADIISCSLLLHLLISRRASEFGAGDAKYPSALLVALIRWSSWSPTVFYRQLILAALTSLSQAVSSNPSSSNAALWRAFVAGRLPYLLVAIEKAVELDGTSDSDWRTAKHVALTTVLHRTDLIQKCDAVENHVTSDSASSTPGAPNFAGEFLHQLLAAGFIEQSFAISLNPNQTNEFHSRIHSEAHENGMDIEAYLEYKLFSENNSMDDNNTMFDRIWKDPCSHAACAEVIRKRFMAAANSLDVETLDQLCQTLYSHDHALDIVALHTKLIDLLSVALALVEDYDCETVGDPQTAVTHLGGVVLFLQSTLARFNLSGSIFELGQRRLSPGLLPFASTVYRADDLDSEDTAAFQSWIKALFDSGSEGIDDAILRSTKPIRLLKLSGTLFSQAIEWTTERKMDREVLNNGISYFLGPLLNWTLAGVIKVLLTECQHRAFYSLIQLEVLQTLLLSQSCPELVLRLTAASVLRTIPTKTRQRLPDTINLLSIRRAALKALGRNSTMPEGADTRHSLPANDAYRGNYTARSIREAVSASRARRSPSIDVDRCLLLSTPAKFLNTLWLELFMAISMGEIETSRRLAMFILTSPRSPQSPPLLPIFIHVTLPTIFPSLEAHPPTEQSMAVELLVAIISSALMAALHTEWALLSVCNDQRFVLGQSVAVMARKLGGDLRRNKESRWSTIIAERLAASQSFATNFPTFMAEM